MRNNKRGKNINPWETNQSNWNSSYGNSNNMGMGMDMSFYQQNNRSFESSISNNNKRNSNNQRQQPVASSSRNYYNSGNDSYNYMIDYDVPEYKNKTPEQIAFDEEFAKWEQSFEGWRRNFANRSNELEFKEYERKFLNVREKLLEKRKQIYSKKSFAREFENQLSAADAMAASILQKFDEPVNRNYGNPSRSNNMNNSSRNMSNNSSRNNSQSRNMSNMNNRNFEDEFAAASIVSLLQGFSQAGMFNNNMQRGPNYGPRNNMGMQPNNMQRGNFGPRNNMSMGRNKNRAGGNNLDKRDINRRNNKTDPIKGNKKDNKSVNDRLKVSTTQLDPQMPFVDRVKILYAEAKKVELPKMLSGATNKRLKIVREKQEKFPEKLTKDEKYFLEYVDYVFVKRREFFNKKKQLEEAEKAKEGVEKSTENSEIKLQSSTDEIKKEGDDVVMTSSSEQPEKCIENMEQA